MKGEVCHASLSLYIDILFLYHEVAKTDYHIITLSELTSVSGFPEGRCGEGKTEGRRFSFYVLWQSKAGVEHVCVIKL